MATIVLRAGKGSPLTNAEVDANFSNINDELVLKLPLSGGTLTGTLNVNFSNASYSTPVSYSNTAAGGGGYMVNLFASSIGSAVAGDALWSNGVGNVIISPNAAGKSLKLVGGAWTGSAGITIDGGNNVALSSGATIGGNTALHAGNYSSYALPLGGGTVTGFLTVKSAYGAAWAPNTSSQQLDIGNTSAPLANSTALLNFFSSYSDNTYAAVKIGSVATAPYSADFIVANRSGGTYQENLRLTYGGDLSITGGVAAQSKFTLGPERRVYVGQLTAAGTTPMRYEIARVYIDIVNWHAAGTIQVELQQGYYYGGDRQVYNINYDYNNISCDLVESIGPSGRSGRVVCGPSVQVSGNLYYMPIFVDTQYYNNYYVYLTTSWPETTSHPGSSGSILVYRTPAGVTTSSFSTVETVKMRADTLMLSGNTTLHSGNYNSYAPTLTGTGASGTWGINISGNAATATSADQIDGWAFRNTGSNFGVNADTIESNGISYYIGGVPNFSGNSTDGALYSQAYNASWQHQIAADYRSGQIALRGKNSGTWQAWRTVLDSANYMSYALPVLANGTITEFGQTISANYTVTSGKNALSAGPITVNDGVTVTVPDGCAWVIV